MPRMSNTAVTGPGDTDTAVLIWSRSRSLSFEGDSYSGPYISLIWTFV